MTTVALPLSNELPQDRDGLVRAFTEVVRIRREADLACATILERLAACGGWEVDSCASVGEFGERHGLAGEDARALLDLGRGIKTTPDLVQQINDGRITVPAAAAISAVLAEPDLLRGDDDWIGWAQRESTAQLRRRVRRRREEVRIGDEPACEVHLLVRPKARDDLDRAREVASRRADRFLSLSETVETTLDYYLQTFDPDRVAAGTRRSPPTSTVQGRYVPTAVRRQVFDRQGRRCAVPFCNHTIFLEFAHIVPHARGGDRETDNLLLLCSAHHEIFDMGAMRMEGSATRPTFVDWRGRPMGERHAVDGVNVANASTTSAASEAAGASSGASPATPAANPVVESSDPPRSKRRDNVRRWIARRRTGYADVDPRDRGGDRPPNRTPDGATSRQPIDLPRDPRDAEDNPKGPPASVRPNRQGPPPFDPLLGSDVPIDERF